MIMVKEGCSGYGMFVGSMFKVRDRGFDGAVLVKGGCGVHWLRIASWCLWGLYWFWKVMVFNG